MIVRSSERFDKALGVAPDLIQKKFHKQIRLLVQNLGHPSLHAKKYSESENIWQARVDKSWRFYFLIQNDTYYLLDIIPHPK